MKAYSAGDRILEYVLLIITGCVCVYGIMSLLIPSRIFESSLFPMAVCSAGVLLLPVFFKKAAKIVGIIAAVAATVVAFYQVYAGGAMKTIAIAFGQPESLLVVVSSSITPLLAALAAASSLIVFFCSKSRIAVVIFWAVNVAVPVSFQCILRSKSPGAYSRTPL